MNETEDKQSRGSWFNKLHPTWQALIALGAAVIFGMGVGGAYFNAQEVRKNVHVNAEALRAVQTRVEQLESDMASIRADLTELKKDSKENLCFAEAEVNPNKHWTECKTS